MLPETLEGVVLCHAGVHRLAVRAREVTDFGAFDAAAPYAGTGFDPSAVAPQTARVLRHHGRALAVDSVEVHAEPLQVLRTPAVLERVWGGALAGFVEIAGRLWPLVSLERVQ